MSRAVQLTLGAAAIAIAAAAGFLGAHWWRRGADVTFQPGPTITWELRTSDALAQAAQQSTEYEYLPSDESPELARFTGTCPACTHPFVFDWPLEAVVISRLAESYVECRCTMPHTDRPADRPAGCGAHWVAELG